MRGTIILAWPILVVTGVAVLRTSNRLHLTLNVSHISRLNRVHLFLINFGEILHHNWATLLLHLNRTVSFFHSSLILFPGLRTLQRLLDQGRGAMRTQMRHLNVG